MKKCFSNIRTLAALLMAGAAFAACSSDDNSIEQPANPTAPKTYTLTVNATKDGSAATRVLELDGTKLVAKWATGDKVYVYKATNRAECTSELGTISPVAGSISANGDQATFTGTLTGTVSNGDKLMLVYHPAAFAITGFEGQAGTLASASALDCATAQVTASVSGSDITISETSATFTTHTAMLKLTLTTDGTTTINPTSLKMSMSLGTTTLKEFTFTPTDATYTANGNGVLYFALPSVEDVAAGLSTPPITITTTQLAGVTITYAATVGSDTYTATKTTGYKFAAGSYYAGTLTMAKPAPSYTMLSAATTADHGKVVCAAGHLHPAKTAVPSGCTAVGILGKVTATGHGLILALKDAATQQTWSTINSWDSETYAGTTMKQLPDNTARSPLTSYTTLGSVDVSNWCVAQKSDYEAIFINLGSAKYDSDGYTYDANVNAYITGAGGTAISESGIYWSATEDGSNVWAFSSGFWNRSGKGYNRSLRPVLGF